MRKILYQIYKVIIRIGQLVFTIQILITICSSEELCTLFFCVFMIKWGNHMLVHDFDDDIEHHNAYDDDDDDTIVDNNTVVDDDDDFVFIDLDD